MTLGELIGPEADLPASWLQTPISGLTADSRAVKPGYLFAALPGSRTDGACFIAEALQKGAAAILVPRGASHALNGTPVIEGSVLYAASYQGRLKALRVNDGTALWERNVSSYLDLAAGYGQVYVVDEFDVIHAFDQSTSEEVWSQRAFYKRGLSAPIVYSSYLIVTDAEGYMHVLSQSDGRIVGRRKIDGDGVRSRGVAMEDLVYFLGNEGKLSAVSIVERG